MVATLSKSTVIIGHGVVIAIILIIALGLLFPHVHDGFVASTCQLVPDEVPAWNVAGCVVVLTNTTVRGKDNTTLQISCEYPWTKCPVAGDNQPCWVDPEEPYHCPYIGSPPRNFGVVMGIVICFLMLISLIIAVIVIYVCDNRCSHRAYISIVDQQT